MAVHDIDGSVELVSKHLPLPCRRWQYLAGDIDGSVELVFADIRAAEHDSLTVSYRHLTADPPDKWGGGDKMYAWKISSSLNLLFMFNLIYNLNTFMYQSNQILKFPK